MTYFLRVRNLAFYLLQQLINLFIRHSLKHDQELIAAHTDLQGTCTAVPVNGCGYGFERIISALVPIVIVHLLQTIHVNENDGQILSDLSLLIKHPASQSFVSETVTESGHRVLCGHI